MKRRRPFRRSRRSPLRNALDLVATIAIIAALALIVDQVKRVSSETLVGSARVSDGDSLVVNGQRIRLEGVDAPELQQTCTRDGAEYPCGQRAREALVKLIGSREVSCESNGEDRYGRILARCVIDERDLAALLVEQGWAVAYGDYRREEADARAQRLGLWGGEFEEPQVWRRTHGGLTEEVHGRGLVALLRNLWHRWTAQ